MFYRISSFFLIFSYTLRVLGLAKLLLVTWFSSLSLSLDRSSLFKNLLLPSSFIRCFSTLPPTLKKKEKKKFPRLGKVGKRTFFSQAALIASHSPANSITFGRRGVLFNA